MSRTLLFSATRSQRVAAVATVVVLLAALLSTLGFASASRADDSVLLSDAMQRTSQDSWGSDPSGGEYTVEAPSARVSVQPGAAMLTAPGPGRTAGVRWGGASAGDVTSITTFALSNAPASGDVYFSAHVRVSGEHSYAAQVRMLPSGRTELALVRSTRTDATVLTQRTVTLASGVTAGARLEVRSTGTDPVLLEARLWTAADIAPDWQVTWSDAGQQRLTSAGSLAWSTYASSRGVPVPIVVSELAAHRVAGAGVPSPTASSVSTPTPTTTTQVTSAPTIPAKDSNNDPIATLVEDPMTRDVAGGWGAAPVGGEWTATRAAVLRVADGTGLIESPAPGRTSVVTLAGTAADVRSSFRLRVPALPDSGSGLYLTHSVRASQDGSYGVRVQVRPSGVADLAIVRTAGLTSDQTLSEVRLPWRLAVGADVSVALEVTGAGVVHLAAKAWPSAVVEPTEWTLTTQDDSAERIDAGGGVRFALYTSRSSEAQAIGIDNVRTIAVASASVPSDSGPQEPDGPEDSSDPAVPGAPNLPVAVRGNPGAPAPGTLVYPVPDASVFVAPDGDDAADGSVQRPKKTVTAALKTVASGGTITLRGGTYHEFVLVPPQKRVTIQPYPNEEVWFDGAERVTDWRADGDVWVKDGWTLELDASPTYKRGAPDNTEPGWQFVNPARPMAAHPDQVWVAGIALREVGSRAEVQPGAFYVDHAGDQLVIGDDPTGRVVESSTLTQAISVRSAGSEVRGVGVRRYATSMPQNGTVIAAADRVTFSDMTIRDNSTSGFYSWSSNTTLKSVSLIGNGVLGGGASTADGLRLERVLSLGNNSEGFNRAPVSGAFKIDRSRNISVVDSAFIGNLGQGPWFDESVYNIIFTGNDVIGNTGNGLVLELSDSAVVADNVVAHNGINGIYVIDTGNAQIWNNTVVGNARNISVTQDRRRASDPAIPGHDPRQPIPDPTMPWVTRNTVVSNNVVADGSGNCLVCVEDSSKEFSASAMVSKVDGNLYRRSASTATQFALWARAGAGASGFRTLAEFTAATGQEQSSLVVDESVVDKFFALSPAFRATQSTTAQAIPADVASASHLTAESKVLGAQRR